MVNKISFFPSVVIKDYDSIWPSNYEYEARIIQEILKSDLLEIHHIGSTSVPGLEAKPIIDLLAVVKDLQFIDSQKGSLKNIGYIWMEEYEMPSRRYYYKYDLSNTQDVVHLHFLEKDNKLIKNYLNFRDYLRDNPLAAQVYGRLKQNLSRLFPDDRERYQEEKSAFIRFITSLSEKKKQTTVPFQMGKHEYGIGFTCDCFPKSKFNNEFAGKRTGITAQASFSKPLYSKILFTVTKAFSDLLYGLLEFFHWLDGHKKAIKPLSEIEDNIT